MAGSRPGSPGRSPPRVRCGGRGAAAAPARSGRRRPGRRQPAAAPHATRTTPRRQPPASRWRAQQPDRGAAPDPSQLPGEGDRRGRTRPAEGPPAGAGEVAGGLASPAQHVEHVRRLRRRGSAVLQARQPRQIVAEALEPGAVASRCRRRQRGDGPRHECRPSRSTSRPCASGRASRPPRSAPRAPRFPGPAAPDAQLLRTPFRRRRGRADGPRPGPTDRGRQWDGRRSVRPAAARRPAARHDPTPAPRRGGGHHATGRAGPAGHSARR